MARLSGDDKFEIAALVTGMPFYADLREWDKAAALFEPRVTLDYTNLFGGEVIETDIASAKAMWANFLSWWDATQHIVSNVQILGDGDEVEALSQFRAIHIKDGRSWVVGGHYTHTLRRTPEGWRLCSLKATRRYEENHEGENSPKTAWLKTLA